MCIPPIATRVKQQSDVSRQRIDPGQIRAFVQIAALAGDCQILSIFGATVLSWDDMFDVVSERGVSLRKQAILAAMSAALANDIPQFGTDH